MITVLFRLSSVIALCMSYSVAVSRELVASINICNPGFLSVALAIEILCLCPPESLMPLWPSIVSYPLWSAEMNSSAPALFAASTIISSE